MIRPFAITVFALLFMYLPLSLAADKKVVVFDFTPQREHDNEWIGAALAEYVSVLFEIAQGYTATERNVVNRMLMRYGYSPSTPSSFEVKDRIREALGGNIVIEGSYTLESNTLRFRGSIVDMVSGELARDLVLQISPFDIFTTQTEIKAQIERAIGAKLRNDRQLFLGTRSESAYISFQKGRIQYEGGKADNALPLLNKSVSSDAKYVAPLLLLGRIYLEKAHYQDATKYLKKATNLAPNNAEAHFLLGMAAFLQRDRRTAETHLKKATKLKSGEPDYHYQLGVFYSENRIFDEAEKELRRAVEADPGMAGAWYKLAALYSMQRKKDETYSALEKSISAGNKEIIGRLKNDADFQWLWNDTRFKQLLQRNSH
ncbi:MAG: tetratricopeptide repeat protein [bacterium]